VISTEIGTTESFRAQARRESSQFVVTRLLTPGGFLYRKDTWTEEVGGFFCGYLPDEIWHYRTDDG
jgi:hypothetical protein